MPALKPAIHEATFLNLPSATAAWWQRIACQAAILFAVSCGL
jgi:hypothetical protein